MGFLITVVLIGWDVRRFIQAGLTPITNLTEQSLHERAKKWLSAHATQNKKLGIERAYLFGSILQYHYPTSDVDLLIVYKPMANRSIARLARYVKRRIATDFKLTFGHRLHVTFYCEGDKHLAGFLVEAGKRDPLDL